MGGESEELLKELKLALDRVYALLEMTGLLRAALSFLYWLIPVSISVIVTSTKFFIENPQMQLTAIATIWGISIPAIVVILTRIARRVSEYYRARGVDVCNLKKLYIAAWSTCWLIEIPIIILLGKDLGNRTPPLALLSALALALTITGIGEKRIFGSSGSLVAALVLYAAIVAMVLIPLASPWGLAVGAITLSYIIATILYLEKSLGKIMALAGSRSHGGQR